MKKSLLFISIIGSLMASDIVFHAKTGLSWQDNRSAMSEKLTYDEAERFCASLKSGNHNNWRIPTLNELSSIVDYTKYDPAILDGFSSGGSVYYWSSTPYKGDSDKVWGINFKSGATDANSKNYTRHIRCVRVNKK
jgi:hypothetical protein